MQGLLETIQKNIEFVGISILLMVIVFAVARGSEILIEKKTGIRFTSEKTKVNKTVIMAMLSAIAVILMYFDFPIPFWQECFLMHGTCFLSIQNFMACLWMYL